MILGSRSQIQLVRVVTSNSGVSSNSGNIVTASGSPVVIGGASSATTVKVDGVYTS